MANNANYGSRNSTANNQKTNRDAIINTAASGGASPKRSDLLNNKPATKSLGNQSANYSEAQESDHWNSSPPPNNPYK